MCFASLLACFWAPCGAHLASVLGSLACPGLSWTCLGDTNVVADLDKLRFFFTMDSRGPPLTRNGAPGHPKTHQNDFKMVARGSRFVALFGSSVWFACFCCLGSLILFFSLMILGMPYATLKKKSMSLSLAFKRSSYTIAMPNSRGGRSEAQHNICPLL